MRHCPDLRLLALPREDPNAACLPQVYKLKKVKMGRGNGSRVTGKGC